MFATINQPYIFMGIIYGGIILGFLYGLFSLLRKAFKNGKAACAVFDTLYFLLALLLILKILYFADDMHIRFYSVFGIATGFFIYYFGLHSLLKFIFLKIRKK